MQVVGLKQFCAFDNMLPLLFALPIHKEVLLI